ncbi:glycoside hydrolase TIM-barrel-like domain-containing protein [Ahrensia kielensis]|uniref:Glycoside hydrolase TIM-barrel-like domain-containing protein n=1 Tax=Ahrensia kielensis TaxID=76980 RepID=A0ABU9T8B7_9HYPH
MATLLLRAAGTVVGSVFGPVGAAIGSALGAVAGNIIDQSIINSTRTIEGARLSGGRPMSAEDGTPMSRVYGYARVTTTVIWATRLEEKKTTKRQGGKGSVTGGPKVTTYSYFASAAFGICEGKIAGIKRIWADGKEIDVRDIEYRFYDGSEAQLPDALIEAKQGSGNAPAFRGTAYIVIERMPLERYGNRLPQIQVEVMRPIGQLEKNVRAVSIIPGATEHGLDPAPVLARIDQLETLELNRHVLHADTDWQASIDELQAVCPNLKHVSLVLAWYADDLRAGHAQIRPGIVTRNSLEETKPWQVSGVTRQSADAHVISQENERSSFGGTPNDASVIAAIADLKSRGLRVTLNPFILVDVPSDNTLPDPYSGGSQPPYPWRGRITPHPAVGQSGSVDGSATAKAQINNFVGSADANDFYTSNGVIFNNSNDFGYRRMILHYAKLAELAGGVDTIIIGSEMHALSTARGASNTFPFVEALIDLANDAAQIVSPNTKLIYGADWSEYFGYHPQDGSGDVFFHLDPLWASPNIAAIGIDNYMPLTDWRASDGEVGHSNPDGMRWSSDTDAMTQAITTGEGFDWYYANYTDRELRVRTPITDGAYGKPWTYRYKDLKSWWSNQHFERIGGVEKASPTSWVPESKPIFMMEIGCSAIHCGANQPNAFIDKNSSETKLPYFSNGSRDDDVQRAFLSAHHNHWTSGVAANPRSPLTNKLMVDPERLYVWTWDARPLPAFPLNVNVWGDGENWLRGHWMNGRLGTAVAAELITAIFNDHGLPYPKTDTLNGSITGMVLSTPASVRATIEPLLKLFGGIASDADDLCFSSIDAYQTHILDRETLVLDGNEPIIERTLSQVSELPNEVQIGFRDQIQDYQARTSYSRRREHTADRQVVLDVPAILDANEARKFADRILSNAWSGRETIKFGLPLSNCALSTGDVIAFDDAPDQHFIIEQITLSDFMAIEARSISKPRQVPVLPTLPGGQETAAFYGAFGGPPELAVLDLPLISGTSENEQLRVASLSSPERAQNIFASATTQGFDLRGVIEQNATIGTLATPLLPAASGRFDYANTIDVDLRNGELESVDMLSLFAGRNLAAVEVANGDWEVLQFANAEEISTDIWRLSALLRGQGGTEDLSSYGANIGAKFILLNDAVTPLGLRDAEIGSVLSFRIGEAGKDFSDRYYTTFSAEGGLRALKPLSPVHICASRSEDNDILIKWVRRGRTNADSWLGLDIPLGEAFERYKIDVLDSAQVILGSFETSQPDFLLTATMANEMFGEQPTSLSLRIAQLSQRVGEGIPAFVHIEIT